MTSPQPHATKPTRRPRKAAELPARPLVLDVEMLVEPWRISNRVNLMLIECITPAGLMCTLSERGGRDVARQFAHMHNVRVWWLEGRAKSLAAGLSTFGHKGDSPSKSELKKRLSESAERVERFFVDAAAGRTRNAGCKRGLGVTIGYFIAHEAHHRGSILLTLKQSGQRLDETMRYGIWDWDRV